MSKREVQLYTREAKRTEAKDPASMLRLLHQLAAHAKGRALRNCELMERGAKRVLRDHGYAEQQERTAKGMRWPNDDAPQAVQLARQVLDGLPQLRRYAKQTQAAASLGLEVGAAYERMRTVVCFGTEALVGAAVGKARQLGRAARSRQRQERAARARAMYERTAKQLPELGHVALCERVAHKLGYAKWTVYSLVKNPRRNKAGRPKKAQQ